jgi:hypothetical protein
VWKSTNADDLIASSDVFDWPIRTVCHENQGVAI